MKARRLAAALLLLAAAGMGQAASRPTPSTAEVDTVEGVLVAVRGGDCALAASRLNAGLSKRYPGIYLLAGTLYDEGVCLRASWERAERMYQAAHEAGHEGGLLRLVAGLARDRRDTAAALWWAQQLRSVPLPAACRLPKTIADDPELFVATLKLWLPSRVQACAHVAGVLSQLSAEVEYPRQALDLSFAGTVALDYQPASGEMTWKTLELEEKGLYGANSGDTVGDRSSRRMRQSLENHLRSLGANVLKRFPRPEGVDPEWRLQMQFVFRLE